MPLIQSTYNSPVYLFNGHLQTIVPAIICSIGKKIYTRERIETSDGDFLDLDWIRKGNKKLALISHGLQGNTYAPYNLRMAKHLSENNWDTLSWNYRGCGDELNRKKYFYHSGFTGDLNEVLHHAISKNLYDEIILIGFSIGGNITLKYLGEQSAAISNKVKKAIVFSVPVDLKSSSTQLSKFSNIIYMKRFLKSFKKIFEEKEKLFPGTFDLKNYSNIKNFHQFDSIYTATLYGFKDVDDYYNRASSKPYLTKIKIPTLIVNALNDPFLSSACFPYEAIEQNELLFLETPSQGGHVGFPEWFSRTWCAKRVLQFWSLSPNL